MKKDEKHALWSWVKKHQRRCFAAVLLVADLVLVWAVFCAHPGRLTVAFLDVGQGDAVFIEGPNGNQVLYDAGSPGGGVLRALSSVMRPWDRSLDIIIASHPDQDHIGGFPEILARYYVAVALEPGATSDNGTYAEVERDIAAEGSAHFLARKGMSVDLGEGAVLDILYPDRDVLHFDTNDASIVMRVRYGETSFLFSGDLPEKIENYLAMSGGEGVFRSDVFKAGHHGSRTSSGERFLDTIQPKIVVISAGKNNRYGHPHKEVIERLRARGIPYLLTATEGTVVLQSDGHTLTKM